MKQTLLKNITGIQHIGMPVVDLKDSVEFYKSLGFDVVMHTELHEDQGIVYVAMVQLANLIIELYQVCGDNLTELKTRKDGVIDHIAINVKDIDEVYKTVKKNGLPIIENAPVFLNFWDKGCRYFTVRGPMKEKIEFNEICN